MRNEKEWKREKKRNESESYPGMTENDRENGVSGKRLRNEFLENSPIFPEILWFSPIFSNILRYSLIFSDFLDYFS